MTHDLFLSHTPKSHSSNRVSIMYGVVFVGSVVVGGVIILGGSIIIIVMVGDGISLVGNIIVIVIVGHTLGGVCGKDRSGQKGAIEHKGVTKK